MTPSAAVDAQPSSTIKSVLLADPIHTVGKDRLKSRFEVLTLPASGPERNRVLESTDVMVVRTFLATGDVMDRMPRLKLVLKHGAGVDNIDIPEATKRGILVANTPGGHNASAVAEGAFALMLGVLRRIREMDQCVRENRYNERWTIALRDVWGSTLGLVGFGRIARNAAHIGGGFKMLTIAYDPFVSAEEMAALNVRKADTLAELLGEADIVSLHVSTTERLIDAAALALMKPTAILINTSRGEVVDEKALLDALREKRIGGAGLDVFDREPPAPDNPLFDIPGVVLSPHVAGVTEASMRDMAMNVAKLIEAVAAGQQPVTLLNSEIWNKRKS